MKAAVHRIAISLILLVHAGLVGWMALRNSPNGNEIAHLPAGLYTWEFGRFDVYPVNPPLVRLIAAAPVALSGPESDWSRYYDDPGLRCEMLMADDFISANGGQRSCHYFFLARLVLLPASLLGGAICFLWARELYGVGCGYVALLLWCFSPNVLTWAACINPDLAATAAGVAALYAYWRWLREPGWGRALIASLLVGLALLTKLTWVVMFGILPVLWLVWAYGRRARTDRAQKTKQVCQLVLILSLGLYLLNLGYALSGSLRPLGQYTFASRLLAGEKAGIGEGRGGNRFRGTLLARVPVPLPKDYLTGIDLQKRDFEQGKDSYLLGRWSEHGWWYYYLVGAAVKVPLGAWGLFLLVLVGACRGRARPASRGNRADSWLDTFSLIFPALFLFAMVSAHTGFSRHFRYVLPVLPLLFIWTSQAASWIHPRRVLGSALVVSCLGWFVVSSLVVFPHSMSYFNELSGGPQGGCRVLLDANLDWGQDLLYLKHWADKHPEARPLYVNSYGHAVLPEALGIGVTADVAFNVNVTLDHRGTIPSALRPGWHAISVHRIHKSYPDLVARTPVARINYSVRVFSGDADSRGPQTQAERLPTR
jgi:hypothetical protein